ncbi:MAG: hypothetical protein HPZ91_07560 [Lentisphaeria bacterium]|nr:hypothetical protein [Lentisphaeria bacterium]
MSLHELMTSMQGAWYEPLSAFLILLLAAYGIGFPLLEKLGARSERCGFGLLALVIGLDLLAILFRLGDYAVIHLPSAWLWSIMAVPAGYGVWRLGRQTQKFRRTDWILWSTVLLLAGITAAPAFVPPFSWDEQSYQVALMYRYLKQGSTAVLADNPYSALSSMPHFLMLWGVKLGGVNFPRMLILGTYLIAIPWIYLLLLRFGRKTALILTAAFLLSPLPGGMLREAYLEPFILLNLMAGAGAIRLLRDRLMPLALLTGFTAGMAAAVKLTGGAASLALVGLFFCVLAFDRIPRKQVGFGLIWFTAAGAVAAVPFYLRPLLATGNPFYPFGSAYIDPATPAAAVEVYHSLLGTSRFGLAGIESFFTSWIVVAYRKEIYDGYVLGWQFPLMLVIGTLSWYFAARRFRRKGIAFLWAAAGGVLFYLFWCASSQQARFILPLFFLVLFYAGSGITFLSTRWRNVALAAIAAATLISFQPEVWRNFYYAWRSMETARKAPADFLRFADREKEYANTLDYIACNLPAAARVMLLFDRRGLYVPRDYVLGTPFFQEAYFTPVPESPERAYDELRRGKIDYIVILIGGESKCNPDPIPDFDRENEQLTLRFLELLKQGKLQFVPVPESGRYRLLKVVR